MNQTIRQMSKDKASELLKRGCILDTETTGLDGNAQIVQLAVIDMQGNVLINQKFNPTCEMSKEAENIHGISLESLKSEPRFSDKWEKEILPVLAANQPVIAYNSDYDKRLLKQTCEAFDFDEPDLKWECAMHLVANYRQEWSGRKWHRDDSSDTASNYACCKLTFAARELGVEVKDAHDALGDIRMTLGVIEKIANSTIEINRQRGDQ